MHKDILPPFLIACSSLGIALYWSLDLLLPRLAESKLYGVFFELLWLPMLIGLFCMPVLSFVLWAREQFSFPSWNIVGFLASSIVLFARMIIL